MIYPPLLISLLLFYPNLMTDQVKKWHPKWLQATRSHGSDTIRAVQ